MTQSKVTAEQYRELAPRGSHYPGIPFREFVDTGKCMMEKLEDVYLSVRTTPLRFPDLQGTVIEYDLFNGPPVFIGTQLSHGENPGHIQHFYEHTFSPIRNVEITLEAIVGKNSSTIRPIAGYQGRITQVEVYHLKGPK